MLINEFYKYELTRIYFIKLNVPFFNNLPLEILYDIYELVEMEKTKARNRRKQEWEKENAIELGRDRFMAMLPINRKIVTLDDEKLF